MGQSGNLMPRSSCPPLLPAEWPDEPALASAGEVAACYAVAGSVHLAAVRAAVLRGAAALRRMDPGAARIATQRAAAEAAMAVLAAIQAETWLAGQQAPSRLATEGARQARLLAQAATADAYRIRQTVIG